MPAGFAYSSWVGLLFALLPAPRQLKTAFSKRKLPKDPDKNLLLMEEYPPVLLAPDCKEPYGIFKLGKTKPLGRS
jgi:hypothetical protein